MTGYIGFYKLKCKKGQWLTFIAQRCSSKKIRKKCGHPGETPNGDFKLIEGKDYIYGATVEYTCKTGYEMTSRISRQVRCPVIHTDEDVIALGNTKEGTYGEVIHFECVSSDKKLDGSSVIHCTENGVWSGPVPQCIVTCQLNITEPEVVRTIPWGKTTFKAGETVGIICSQIFQKQEIFTCTKNGKWDYKPTCQEIRCEVPLDQHVYLPKFYFKENHNLGAKRSYGCESGYNKTAEKATCTRDGWTPKPLCAEIKCGPPRIPNAQIVGGQKQEYKISSRIEYKCHPGYEPEQPVQITCDSEGQWTGIQQCSDGTCEEQDLKNIKILFGHPSIASPYKPGHILVFQCTDDNMRFYGQRAVECQPDGRWNYPYPHCGGTVQCPKPTKNLRLVTLLDEKAMYSNFETLKYTCKKPYNKVPSGALMCQNGRWNGTYDCTNFNTVSTKDNVTTAVSYTCQPYYVLTKQQDQFIRPCEIDDIVEQYNLKLPTEKVFIKHGDKYRLNCKAGWNTGSEMKAHVDVSCSNGNLQIDKMVKCPAINTDGDVTASGNTEEGSYGDVIHFECASSDKMIVGSSEIHCKETGKWSDSVPKCKGITCTAPDIPNGQVVEQMPEYQKDAILKYKCNPGSNCELSTTFGIKKIIPEGKLFLELEKVWRSPALKNTGSLRLDVKFHVTSIADMKLGTKQYYNCEAGYEKMAEVATCTEDGWTPKPLCEKKMCAAPNIPNAEIVGGWKSKYQTNSRILYKCLPGFEPEQPVQITCNFQAHWTGIQECTELCPDPSVKNGFIYKHPSNKKKIFYSCNTGYKPFSGKWWDSVTCSKGSWSDEPRCIREEECGALPSVHHGKLKQTKHTFHDGDTTEFECDPGFISTPRFIKCINGAWEKPVCKEDARCDIPTKVENAVITSEPEEFYVDGSSVTYVCRNSFSISGKSMVFCRNGTWEETPTCQGTCVLKSTTSEVKNIKPEGKTIFRAGESVEITCSVKSLFSTTETKKSCTCQNNGQWDYEPDCQEIRCQVPRDQHVSYPEYYFRADMKLGTKQYYNCEVGYEKMAAEATCTEDGWTPNPLCAKMCAAPNIPNAEIVGARNQNIKSIQEYYINVFLDLNQSSLYKSPVISRLTGQAYRNALVCYKLCPDPSVKNGFIYKHPSNKKKIFYSCNTGYKPFSGKWWDSVTCSKGSWSDEPHCIREGGRMWCSSQCCKVKQTKHTFRDGNTTEFECDPGFISTPGFIKCINGTWEKTVCKEGMRCDIPPKVENAVITSKPEEFYVDGSRTCVLKSTTSEVKNIKPEGKTIFRAGESVEITCSVKSLFSTTETKKSCTCQNNGQWDYEPDCQGKIIEKHFWIW
ncbi:Complement factor H [Labeo rohita]|uniref:Complement factor H n=1 Tax=Labeo rohita TaxID=84645 RepID=A0ABQ8LI30_LABRO|nr:Complement factor H [Labeo rohita]